MKRAALRQLFFLSKFLVQLQNFVRLNIKRASTSSAVTHLKRIYIDNNAHRAVPLIGL
jgi:hypothetical protein